jgi:membrane protease YdiL (CAAX protease family)
MAAESGVAPVLAKFPFQKYFNRSLLLSALGLLRPFGGWLGVRPRWREQLALGNTGWRQLGFGFVLGSAVMCLLAGICLSGGFYALKGTPGADVVLKALASACMVGFLEEWLFRGMLMDVLRHSLSASRALWVCSALFAIVHFLKPNPAVKIPEVFWYSGWVLVPEMFHQFSKPLLVLGGFGTLLTLGGVLGLAALRTQGLGMSIGLHAGIVFIKLLFTKMSIQQSQSLPWIGPELQVGLIPVGLLLLTGLGVLLTTRPPAIPAPDA